MILDDSLSINNFTWYFICYFKVFNYLHYLYIFYELCQHVLLSLVTIIVYSITQYGTRWAPKWEPVS